MTISSEPEAPLKESRPDPARRLQLRSDPVLQPESSERQANPKPPLSTSGGRLWSNGLKPLRKIELYITAIFKLGRTAWMAKQSFRKSQELEISIVDLMNTITNHTRDLSKALSSIEAHEEKHRRLDAAVPLQMGEYKADLAVLSATISDLTARLDRLVVHDGGAGEAPERLEPDKTDGFQAFKDQFYHRLENRYRGDRSEIAGRLRTYLPDVEAAVLRTGPLPVMDLGCGRGEWVELLSTTGIEAVGIDTNAIQIAEGRQRGLDLRLGEALTILGEAESDSLSVISAHHLIEHLPFDQVAWITREAMRVLAPGGLLLFETPNTRNILVGATTFHTDPTHLKPMPEQIMGVLLETAGFHPVEIRHLHPHERFEEFLSKQDMNDEVAFLLFGPQDLCILGRKPNLED